MLERSTKRLELLQQTTTHETEWLSFEFAHELLPSAIAAYGRPVIDSHEDGGKRSVTFEWKYMFWLFDKDGTQIRVVMEDETPKKERIFSRNDLSSFIENHICVPSGMPAIGDQSEHLKNEY